MATQIAKYQETTVQVRKHTIGSANRPQMQFGVYFSCVPKEGFGCYKAVWVVLDRLGHVILPLLNLSLLIILHNNASNFDDVHIHLYVDKMVDGGVTFGNIVLPHCIYIQSQFLECVLVCV